MENEKMRKWNGIREVHWIIVSVLSFILFLSILSVYLDLLPAMVLFSVYVLLGSIFIVWGSREAEDQQFLLRVFFIGFLIRVVTCFFLQANPEVLYESGFRDHIQYYHGGLRLAKLLRISGSQILLHPSQVVHEYGFRNWGFHLFNAVHFLVSGNALLPVISNTFIGTLTIVLIYKLAVRLADRNIARISAWLVTLSPSFVFWSALNHRDIAIVFFITLIALTADHLRQEISLEWIFVLGICILALFSLRWYVTIVIIGLVVLHLLLSDRLPILPKVLTVALTIAFAICLYRFTPTGQRYVDRYSEGGLLEVQSIISSGWNYKICSLE